MTRWHDCQPFATAARRIKASSFTIDGQIRVTRDVAATNDIVPAGVNYKF
jgi:hypothetical protein